MTLQLCVARCALAISPRGSGDSTSADELPPGAPPDFPDDDDGWEEFDPTPLERWILDDFEWDIEESYPQRGDYWDDSLDREWDCALMTNDEVRMTKQNRMTNGDRVSSPPDPSPLTPTINAFLLPC